jgi:hypothetical protein
MGIIVNFMDRTVQGFGSYPVKITVWNDVNVEFNGTNGHKLALRRTIGIMDRVTGDVDATSTMTNTKTDRIVSSLSYALKCKPTQRMF